MITGVLSAKRGYFNYYAELETAGKCFEWVVKHLALDEIGVYLSQVKVTDDIESKFACLSYTTSVVLFWADIEEKLNRKQKQETPWDQGTSATVSANVSAISEYSAQARSEGFSEKRGGGYYVVIICYSGDTHVGGNQSALQGRHSRR